MSSSDGGLHGDFYDTTDGHEHYHTNDDKNDADYQPGMGNDDIDNPDPSPRLNHMLRELKSNLNGEA